jgi:hypothetical protein
VWVRGWKSELVLLNLGKDGWLQPHASDPSVGGLPSEVRAADSFASIPGNNDP